MDKKRIKQFKKAAKHDDAAIQKGLMSIYSNADGSLPDISHLDVQRRGRLRLAILILVGVGLLLSAVTWLGFLVFNPQKVFSNKSIKLAISAEQNLAAGSEMTYVLDYKNIEKVDLKNVEIIFRFPEGFEFISAEPKASNEFNTVWQIGDLAKDAGGKIEIKGKMIGEVGAIKTINVTATFQPANFSSTFKETNSFNSQITSSILEMNVEGPKQILPEKKAIYRITYKNNSNQSLGQAKVIVTYPPNFLYQDAEPKPFHRAEDARKLNNEWVIENLAENLEGQIEITGGYVADPQNVMANFNVKIGFVNAENGEFSLQQEKTVTTEITDSSLTLDLIINGSTQNQPINFGQTLAYSLVYKNLGTKDLDDVSLCVALESDVLDWGTLDDKHQGKVAGSAVCWNKDQISQLDLVRPLDQGAIDFTINVAEAEKINLAKANLLVKSKGSAMMVKVGEIDVPDLKVETAEIQSNINTDVQLKVEGRYFDDDNIAVGDGPLPPVVGQKTSFRIYWYLANSFHEITEVKVKAILPEGVEFNNKFMAKAGQIAYSSQTREISWTINRIPPNKGFAEINAWFDVSVIPAPSQVRKLLILVGQAELTAKDKQTESLISKTSKAVTSNLEDDPNASGKGLVIDITE